jgi:putative drug exporter of the RND superfamily
VLYRLGHASARRHWIVVGVWVGAIVAVWAVAIGVGGQANNNFTLPGASSQDALDQLSTSFPEAAASSATIVYHGRDGATVTPGGTLGQQIQQSLDDVANLPHVAQVVGPSENPALVSKNGTTALANVVYDAPTDELPDNGVETFDQLQDAVAEYRTGSLAIELGGTLPGSQPIDIKPVLVLYGLIAALIILAIALATWWSFMWPVVTALVGVALGVGLLRILQSIIAVPSISETTAVMIGLGVGIDYGLFVIGRSVDYIAAGDTPDAGAAHAISTIGRAVLTAGTTVIVALVALLVFQVPSVTAIAYSVVLVVAAVVVSSVTLGPAVVGAVGEKLATSTVPWHRRNRGTATLTQRWANLVTRTAPLMLACSLVLLVVLAIPVFSGDLRLGPLDTSLYPTDSTQYDAWKLESEAFGPGSPNPFLVVVQVPNDDAQFSSQLQTLVQGVEQTEGVAAVTPPQTNAAKTTTVFQVIPTSDAQAEATSQLVDRLRDETFPASTKGTSLDPLLTGRNAIFADLDTRITDRLMLFIGLVVLIALVILGFVFRSVAVPIKAACLNILTILATYGVIVAFFTYGWGRSWIGVDQDIPILSLLAPVFFAVLFGLSNDYEVYLVSRMREERQAGRSASEAVRVGVGQGGHVVIAAALIMVFVFLSYVVQPGSPVKQFGLGMAVAILIDAFVTRMVALPAAMRLGGDHMWWPGLRAFESTAGTDGVEEEAALSGR